MDLKLRVNTQRKTETRLELDDEELEPVSPISEYLSSGVVTLYVLCFFELEIPVHFPSIIAFLNDVVVNVHPRFSSILIENKKGRKMWKKVAVNVKDHMKVPSFSEDLSTENFSEQFDKYISKIATSPFPPNKPLWEFHVINCPKDYHAPAIFILKCHHAIGDGTSLMAATFTFIKRVDDPSLPLTLPPKTKISIPKFEHTTNYLKTLMNFFMIIVPNLISSIMNSLYDFGRGVRLFISEDSKTPIRSGNADMTRPFSTRICALTLPLNDVKRIKNHIGVTVNDVIVGIIFLATRLYIQEETSEQGQLKNTRSRASILVNVRNVKESLSVEEMKKRNLWGNRVSVIELPLPSLEDEDVTNPLNFIMNAHKIIKRKRSGIFSPYLTAGLLNLIKKFAGLQTAAQTFERLWRNSSFTITNVIGPTEQISIANHPVKDFYFIPTGGNVSLAVSVMSYMDTLRLGLVVENGFIHHQRLSTCVEKAFQLIFQAAEATSN